MLIRLQKTGALLPRQGSFVETPRKGLQTCLVLNRNLPRVSVILELDSTIWWRWVRPTMEIANKALIHSQCANRSLAIVPMQKCQKAAVPSWPGLTSDLVSAEPKQTN